MSNYALGEIGKLTGFKAHCALRATKRVQAGWEQERCRRLFHALSIEIV